MIEIKCKCKSKTMHINRPMPSLNSYTKSNLLDLTKRFWDYNDLQAELAFNVHH